MQRNASAHIGWSALRLTPAGQRIFGNVLQVHAFNWHYESLAIPQHATQTLLGGPCRNKAFVFGKRLAFKGHFEVKEDIVRSWCVSVGFTPTSAG